MAVAGRYPESSNRVGAALDLFPPAFLGGTLLLGTFERLPQIGLIACLLVAGLAAVRLKRYRPRLSALLLGACLGFTYCALHAHSTLASRLPASQNGTERAFDGVIGNLPVIVDTERGLIARFTYVPRDDDLKRIRVAWYHPDVLPAAGECWRLTLRLRSPRGSLNPGGYDYEGWLFRQGLDATASVRAAQRCASDKPLSIAAMRQRVGDAIRTLLPDHPMRAFVLGLAIGDRSEIETGQWRVLRRTGVSHLLAISGLHIGLVAGFVFFLVRRSWSVVPRWVQALPAPKAAAMAAGLAGLAYASLAGFALPTQRALCMLVIVLMAIWWGQRVHAARLLNCALLLVILVDPFAAYEPGFWLSFAAVGWILYALSARIQAAGSLRKWLWLQVVLGCTLLPLTLVWFGEGSWVASGVNLVLIPLFFLLVPLILLASILMFLWPAAAGWVMLVPAGVLNMIWQGLAFLEGQLPLVVSGPAPHWLAVTIACMGLLWLFAPRGWPARATGLLLCLPVALSLGDKAPNARSAGELRMTVLDVGQGLSVVLQSAEHVLVYDAGPAYEAGFDAGAMVVVPFLRHQGITRVDRYVQSHGDLDHRGGSGALRSEMNVVDELGTDAVCRKGQTWSWDGIEFEVLHPDSDIWRDNNASCVLRVAVGDYSVLLTGDIERPAETSLLQHSAEKIKADVLLVPHHGSNSSSGIGLLNAVQPQLAIVSSGWQNRWGMPRPVVLRRYAARNIPVMNTAETGAITIHIHPDTGLSGTVIARQQQRRFWSAD